MTILEARRCLPQLPLDGDEWARENPVEHGEDVRVKTEKFNELLERLKKGETVTWGEVFDCESTRDRLNRQDQETRHFGVYDDE